MCSKEQWPKHTLAKRILEVWRECSDENDIDAHVVSEFRPQDIAKIDIDGRLAKERANTQAKASIPIRRVIFPGVHLSEPLKRSRWMMLRNLYRRTGSDYSWTELDRTFTHNAIITKFIAPGAETDRDAVTNLTVDLLSRLPSMPPPLPNHILLTEDSIAGSWLQINANSYSWEDLPTVQKLSGGVIRMGISISLTYNRSSDADTKNLESHNFRQFLDFLSDLIDGAFHEFEKGPAKYNNTWRWFILITYLWSTWHRCLALHY
ncbi:uncharacterized protein F4822DRAFT_280763 [Hypoxylon trugodes]|uniref:uncharacterized protein n=1 Tax=Hypoxylon trugodes TaxID=326681 RepID=UPI00219EDF15|nr:uncharacterized protein F4822DRAFT_280763 [Hypoxylon trugodes]KAI1387388.1 hypothetical protein F4822DRAFT_280763 [Hypoxylon trugodes]